MYRIVARLTRWGLFLSIIIFGIFLNENAILAKENHKERDMKTLNIPFIDGLESMNYAELHEAMETGATKSLVNVVNWEEYPYCPDVAFLVARSKTHLCVLYHVKGFDLRATALEDNGNVWEDSCCEFFVADPTDGTYYNFEMNCIGSLLAAKRTGREDAVPFSIEKLQRVVRHSTLPHESCELEGETFEWSVAMCIPFDMIGVDSTSLPQYLMVNFYKCGDKTAHPHFLSWNPIDVPSPDFHRPEFFGKICF